MIRPAAIAAALASLVVGALAVVNPPASAGGDVPDPADAVIRLHYLDPVRSTAETTTDVVYPVKDRYIDRVGIHVDPGVEVPYDGYVVFTIKSSDGRVVFHESAEDDSHYPEAAYAIEWWPTDGAGTPLAEGRYRIVARMHWPTGEVTQASRGVRVSHAKKTWLTFRRTVRPSSVMLGKRVGQCTSLEKPARAGWPGSLGYRSQSGCRRRHAGVSTTHGIRVPWSPWGHFGALRVTVVGGRPPGAMRSYLALWHYTYNNGWDEHTVRYLGGKSGKHPGLRISTGVIGNGINGDYSLPRTLWAVGLADGAAFDVRRFTIKLHYMGLR